MNKKRFYLVTLTFLATALLLLFSFFSVLSGATNYPAPLPANTRNLSDPSYMIVNQGSNSVLNQPWMLQGIEATMDACDPEVSHTPGSDQFFFSYIRMYQGSNSIMVGWSECAWQPDRPIVTEYDSKSNNWNFYPQYEVGHFKITYQDNGVWQAWVDSGGWQLLTSVQLDMVPSNQTYAEMGLSEYCPTQNWFVIPQTGMQAYTIPSSPGMGGAGTHSFYQVYSNRNPPPIYQLGFADYANMIHLFTITPTPTATPTATPTLLPTATPIPTPIPEMPTLTPTSIPTPTETSIQSPPVTLTPTTTPSLIETPTNSSSSTPNPTTAITPTPTVTSTIEAPTSTTALTPTATVQPVPSSSGETIPENPTPIMIVIMLATVTFAVVFLEVRKKRR